MQTGNFTPFVNLQFTGVHINQYMGVVPVQATHPVVKVHRQKDVRITQCMDSVCHLSYYLIDCKYKFEGKSTQLQAFQLCCKAQTSVCLQALSNKTPKVVSPCFRNKVTEQHHNSSFTGIRHHSPLFPKFFASILLTHIRF